MPTYYVFDRCIKNTVTVRAAKYKGGPYYSNFVIRKGVRRKVDFDDPQDVCRNCNNLNTDRCPKVKPTVSKKRTIEKKDKAGGPTLIRFRRGK